ncbi:hypothetical protein R0381_002112 [Jeongeupia wiesaeckerbachi]|uniref:hypothetical protein n=1 Tax=Jeongeupia wiesaeckerbachi TaxID=3051218 RepID=UPI003D8065C3
MSLIFSPIFGAWLHAKNWRTLGDEEKAEQSMLWAYGGIGILILLMFLPSSSGGPIGLGYLLAWNFFSARQQAMQIKERLGDNYKKKHWGKPVGIAIATLLALFLAADAASEYIGTKKLQESVLTDVSGVWSADPSGILVTLKLDGTNKSITVNGNESPVTIKNFDEKNKTFTVVFNNTPSTTWSIKPNFVNDRNFNLTLTVQDGSLIKLYFVRNL